jgi:hypothetical protein
MTSATFDYLGLRWEGKPQAIAAIPMIPHRPGQKLPNGAILLDREVVREYEFRRDEIVLCLADSPYTPYITWHRLITSDSPLATGGYHIVDTCMSGDYFKTLDEAMTGFADRVTQQRARLA